MLETAQQALLLAHLLGRATARTEAGQALAASTDLPFAEAIEWFKAKRIVSPSELRRLSESAKLQAFSVAGLTSQYGLTEAHRVLGEALEQGTPQKAAVKQMREALASAGLAGPSKYHLDIVFRNNVLGSYQAGRYAQLKAVARRRPFWRYRTVGDHRVRPAHKAMDGKIYPADSPVWDTWYPPCGHQCRCTVESLSPDDMQREGFEPEPSPPAVEPDKGWAGSPATLQRSQEDAKGRVRTALRSKGLLQPPKLATSGTRAYVAPGDIGPRESARRAGVVARGAGLTRAEIAGKLADGPFAVEQIKALPRGVVQARVPVPSQLADSAEQLMQQLLADPQTAALARELRIAPRQWFSPAAPSPSSLTAVAMPGGACGSDLLLTINARQQSAARLAQLALRAQAGAEGAIRRAADVADVVLRGVLQPPAGYRTAYLCWRPGGVAAEARLTRAKIRGYISEHVAITEARWSQLT